MAEDFSEYMKYFHHGLRVELGIRMPNRDIFREWAIVQDYHEDVIEVELSRDYLPHSVKFEVGSIVDVGVWIKDQVYTCNAIVIEKNNSINFIIRLLSSVMLKERREFFRLGVTLRVKFARTTGHNGGEVRVEWEKRSELEHLKFQEGVSNYLHSPYIVSKWAHLKPSGAPLEWVESLSMPAVLSGGGIRFLLPIELKIEEKLNLEIHLPLMPTRVVHAVAEVIHVMEYVRNANSHEPFFPTGMRFSYLEEHDRDLLIRYISAEQMEQLRKLSTSLRYIEDLESENKRQLTPLQLAWRLVAAALALILTIWFLVDYYEMYKKGMEKNEIESTYGKELGKYRNKRHIDDNTRQ